MLIEVISVSKTETVPTKNGKSYEKLEVLYRDKDGKPQGKKLVSWTNPSVFKAVKDWEAGHKVNVKTEKDENGYWQWTAIEDGDEEVVTKPAYQGKTETKTVSNYETREERQQRQVYIIRQSSLGHAIEFLGQGKSAKTVEDVISVADEFFNYVINGKEKDLFEDFVDDVPQ